MTMTEDRPTTDTGAADKYAPRRITLTPDQVVSLASVVAAASTDDVTPVITAVQVTFNAPCVVARATDRYRVAELTFNLADEQEWVSPRGGVAARWEEGTTVLIPRALLIDAGKAASKGSKHLGSMPVVNLLIATIPDARRATLGTEQRTVTFEHAYDGWSVSAATQDGNYPQVGRLIPPVGDSKRCEMPVGTPLNPAYLADLVKFRLPGESLADVKRVAYAITGTSTEHPTKPGPVIFERHDGADRSLASITYLVQPNLRLR